MKALHRILALLVVAVVATAVARGEGAPSGAVDKATQVKAAFVVNFAKYASWPAETFEDDAAPIRIVVLGRSAPIGRELERVVRDKQVGQRPVEVERLELPPDGRSLSEADQAALQASHVVVLCASANKVADAVLDAVADHPVLTIGDLDDFCQDGGMLNFVERKGRIAFQANPDAIRAAKLKVSSKLLRLADIVTTEE